MGGFFGVASKQDCMLDTFFGTDYHSHLGTYAGGMAAWDSEIGLQRRIHGIVPALAGIMYNFEDWWIPRSQQKIQAMP